MKHLTSLLPGSFAPSAKSLRELFDEYEEGMSQEAILVKDVDKYEMLLQAIEYERDAIQRGDMMDGVKDLTPFFDAQKSLKTNIVKAWASEVMKEREQLWKTTNDRTEDRNNRI